MGIANGEISLDKLLDNKKLTLGFVETRPYGGTVNKVVKEKNSK